MEQPNDASADSSPAQPLSGTDFLESLSGSERTAFFEAPAAERLERMAKPSSEKAPKAQTDAPAASSPAEPAEQAASTDASPKADSEPAAPAKTKGLDAREEQIRTRQARLKADLAEIDRLEREVSERQARLNAPASPKQDATPESSPAEKKRAFDQYALDPRAPKLEAFEDYNAWAVEMMDFISDRKLEQRDTQAREQHATIQRERELNTAVETSKTRFNAFVEQTPDFSERVNPGLLNIAPISALKDGDPIGPHNFVAEQIWRSEFPGELALHFSEHPTEFQALCDLNDPAAITRRIGRIEAAFDRPSAERASQPVPKTIPDADELPVLVGKKAPVTGSDTDSALKAKDFRAYEAARKREWGLKD